jgi:putative colanic acid biosynthesis UDP-glucose lipid carrier transferase
MPIFQDQTIPTVSSQGALSTSGRVLAVEGQHPASAGIGSQLAASTVHRNWVKRALDIVGASLAIVILSPVLAIAAIAIKLDSAGPVMFRQRRYGLNGIPFVIYKFRTMTVLEDGPTVTQAQRLDPRVTRIGRFLRSSSVDELPQLFNVLMGDMSLVGPRPHPIALDNKYKPLIADYAFRYRVAPGITGWAQVNGLRGETRQLEQMIERITFDLWYINRVSLGLDIYILLRTCFEVMRNRAY